ncbi:MAG: S41 family peptidase [Acetatifactor sp.]|nr:S41 family peptidase [Acetatifactor sp.]
MAEDNQYFNHTDNMPTGNQTGPDKSANKLPFVIGLFVGILLTVAVGGVYVSGVKAQQMIDSKKETQTASNGKVADSATIAKINALESTIDKYFYLDRVDNEDLREGIFKGMMDALNDPYTEYYTEDELNEMMDGTEGIYYGIGAYVSLDSITGLPKVSGIIANSPAEEADLRPEDIIYEVNGESTQGLTLTETVKLIKGPEGTPVELKLIRDGEHDYLEVTLIRRKVESPTVEFEMKEDGIAYIQVTEFDDVTEDQFAEALAMAKGSDAKGIILDLRGNPGGNLSTVVAMCRMILPEGMIVYTIDKNEKRTEYKCDGKRQLDLPLVVLIDGNSASAAEIMSGAIKDHGIGTLVGTTTFGKGIVQQIVPFRDGSAVKITISAYYTPSGKNIHGIGIEPDVECKFDSEAYYDTEDHYDNQLEKAKEVLLEKIK